MSQGGVFLLISEAVPARPNVLVIHQWHGLEGYPILGEQDRHGDTDMVILDSGYPR